MSVAASDSGVGASIRSDLKAFLRCGVYGTTAVVATTAQDTVGVTDIYLRQALTAIRSREGVRTRPECRPAEPDPGNADGERRI